MRVCIPVEKNEGAESKPYNHFGSAPKFLIVNLEGEEIEVIDNGEHRLCFGRVKQLKEILMNTRNFLQKLMTA